VTPAQSHETVDERYARELGEAAFERQKRERGERHPVLRGARRGGHHLACSKRPADDRPVHVEGQEALL
jgi:hypothetical protein